MGTIRKRVNLAGRARETETIEWYAEERWTADRQPSSRSIRIACVINSRRYWDGHERSMERANDICRQVFGEDNFDGPWHDN